MAPTMAGYRQPTARTQRRAEQIGTKAAAQELLDQAAASTEEAAAILRSSGREEMAARATNRILAAIGAGQETIAREERAQRRAQQADAEAHDAALQAAIRRAQAGAQERRTG